MKRKIMIGVAVLAIALVLLKVGISVFSNPQIDSKLVGLWTEYYDEDEGFLFFEDGVCWIDGEELRYSVKDDRLIIDSDDRTVKWEYKIADNVMLVVTDDGEKHLFVKR